ncbi:MAG TPA: FliM/FliN family flagellar motor switch protein [Solirubrobacteraceae bacterium]|nr:FliM/FliN family flagellar motor switch protein [Solirubrobacteraceae bacterium]
MSDQGLLRIASSTAEAVGQTLATFAPGEVEMTGCAIVPDGGSPLQALPIPGVVCRVSYVDGVSGGNIFAISAAGAHKLAAAMMGTEPESLEAPLDELELSAIGEATNQMMGAAAMATGAVLGMEVDISPPDTREVWTPQEAEGIVVDAPNATTAGFTVFGEQCRFVQLMPHAFALRVQRALDEIEEAFAPEPVHDPLARAGLASALAGVSVRVSAELGRAPRPLHHVLGLPAGSVVELDREVDDPIDLYVNGARFATGRLVVGDDARWAVRIESVLSGPQATNQGG